MSGDGTGAGTDPRQAGQRLRDSLVVVLAVEAGVVNVTWMSTVICGYEELSTWPTSCFVMTGVSPIASLVVLVASHLT